MRLIIAGSRDITDIEIVEKAYMLFVKRHGRASMIISGNARGVDRLGEKLAKSKGIPLVICPANWGYHGKRAGFLRNETMAELGDALLAVWDRKSKGTMNMINSAERKELVVLVHAV